jgi:hypothetical protein
MMLEPFILAFDNITIIMICKLYFIFFYVGVAHLTFSYEPPLPIYITLVHSRSCIVCEPPGMCLIMLLSSALL